MGSDFKIQPVVVPSFVKIPRRLRFRLWLHRKVWPLFGVKEDPVLTALKDEVARSLDNVMINGQRNIVLSEPMKIEELETDEMTWDWPGPGYLERRRPSDDWPEH